MAILKKKKTEEVVVDTPATPTEPVYAKAIAKTIRITPRKARMVVDLVRGKDLKEVYAILANTNKSATAPVTKVIKSAAANATNNFQLDADKLYLKEIYVDDSIRMKRYMPRAKGSASALVKRTCHITAIVAERVQEGSVTWDKK